MIRLFVVVLIGITIFSIYYDLTTGTIPATIVESMPASNIVQLIENTNETDNVVIEENFILIEVKRGDTILTLVERYTDGPLPVTVPQLVSDFEALNNVPPEKIQIGKTYKIPIYK